MSRLEQLVALVADRPDGAKVDLSALVRAFTPTVSGIARAIEHLIVDGKLDAKTLRRPACAANQTDPKCLAETPAEAPEPKPTEPPVPKAVEEGGGDARNVAPPPINLGRLLNCFGDEFETLRIVAQRFGATSPQKIVRHARTLHERGLVEQAPPIDGQPFCLWRRARNSPGRASLAGGEVADEPRPPLNQDTKGASAPAREARSATESTAAKPNPSARRIEDRAPHVEPAPPNCPPAAPARSVDLKVNKRRDPTQPPDLPLTELRDRQVTSGHRHSAAVRRGQEEEATRLVDEGVDPSKISSSVIANTMRTVIRRREEDARRADPVEQAKTKLRKRFTPVVGAELMGGPAGKFYVGRKLVTKAELLDMARRLAA